jgi:hypothetical protein
MDGKTTDYIKRIFEREGVKNWDGGTKWQSTTLMSMLENEKYKGDALLQKSYTVDFLTKKRIQNKGEIQMFYVEDDYDTIISTVAEDVFNEIRQFYVPKCYNDKKEYVETADLQAFILSNSPFCVLDAIEFFAKHSISDDFEPQINAILKLNEIPFQLSKGKLMNTFDTQINKNSLVSVQEVGLKELLQKASKYYDENNLQIAVEKLWDAFERLKTYYCSSTVDKKKSVNKIIMDMGNNQQPFLELFEKEFHELTILGNNFRIRHHETTKTDIQDKRHYEYFYKRCLSLISTAIQYLDGRGL